VSVSPKLDFLILKKLKIDQSTFSLYY